jgi:hypothetical protein
MSREDHTPEIIQLNLQRDTLLAKRLDAPTRAQLAKLKADMDSVAMQLTALPGQGLVYAAATQFANEGNFTPTGGTPRPIYLLTRGNEATPDKDRGENTPHAISAFAHLNHHFDLPDGHD